MIMMGISLGGSLVFRIVSLLIFFSSFSLANSCYYPSGRQAVGHVPCPSTSGTASCCAAGAYCIGDGLCVGAKQGLRRGSCTDNSWGSECSSYCSKELPHGEATRTPCGINIHDTTTWTCGIQQTLCKKNNFTLSAMKIHLRADQLQVSTTQTQTGMQQPSGSATPAATANTNGVPEISSKQDVGAECSSNRESTVTSSCPIVTSPATIAAVAVGCSLPLLIALSVAVALWLLKRAQRDLQEATRDMSTRAMTMRTGGQAWEDEFFNSKAKRKSTWFTRKGTGFGDSESKVFPSGFKRSATTLSTLDSSHESENRIPEKMLPALPVEQDKVGPQVTFER